MKSIEERILLECRKGFSSPELTSMDLRITRESGAEYGLPDRFEFYIVDLLGACDLPPVTFVVLGGKLFCDGKHKTLAKLLKTDRYLETRGLTPLQLAQLFCPDLGVYEAPGKLAHIGGNAQASALSLYYQGIQLRLGESGGAPEVCELPDGGVQLTFWQLVVFIPTPESETLKYTFTITPDYTITSRVENFPNREH